MSPPDPTAAHDGKLCEVDNNGSCPMFSFVTTCISTKALTFSPRGLNPTGEHNEILNEGCHFYNVAGNEVPHSVKDTNSSTQLKQKKCRCWERKEPTRYAPEIRSSCRLSVTFQL